MAGLRASATNAGRSKLEGRKEKTSSLHLCALAARFSCFPIVTRVTEELEVFLLQLRAAVFTLDDMIDDQPLL